jgi:hypothetical protein
MKFKKPKPKQYQQASDGIHPAVLADLQDIGEKQTQFGTKPKIWLTYLTGDEQDAEGKPIRVSQYLVNSIHPKANLYNLILTLTGTEPTDDFDSEDLIGRQCRVKTLRYTNRKGLVYAGVNRVFPANGDPEVAIPLDFVRANERKN